MTYISVDVDVDIHDILGTWSGAELTGLAADLLREGHVPDGWAEVDDSTSKNLDLSDSAVLLDVIVELRRMGYTVEPGGK